MLRGMPQPGPRERELLTKFKVLKFLGKGSYGSVFQVQRLGDGKTYALKEMDVRSMSQAEREDSANEIRLLASIQHPNVIAYHEAFLDGNRLCIIMEYAPDGDLAKVIKKASMSKRPLPEDLCWKYFIQVGRGLQALHNMKILHRDIKPGNIMIMANDAAKIGDLGISKLLKHTMAKTQIGTPHYMPPEIWKNRPYSFSSDTWALGCLLYEMATLNVPFEARSMSELRYKVMRGTYPPITGNFSRELVQMVRDCLDPNPDRRPTMDQILASPAVVQRMHLLPSEVVKQPPSTAGSVLLDTIKVPRNFALIKNKMPPAQYPNQGFGRIDEDEEYEPEPPPNSRPVQPRREPPQVMKPSYPPSTAAPSEAPSRVPNLPQLQPRNPAAAAAAAAAQRRAMAPPQGREQLEGLRDNSPESRPESRERVPMKAPALINPFLPQQKRAPPSVQTKAAAAAQERMWYPQDSRISESHAAYGAFYHHNMLTPTGAEPSPQSKAAAVWGAFAPYGPPIPVPVAAPLPPLKSPFFVGAYQPVQRHYIPGQGAYNQNPPNMKLAPLGSAAPRQGVPGPDKGGPKQVPPWNYGAGGKLASRAGRGDAGPMVSNVPASAQGNQQQMPRYPPPQWNPKPARW